MAKEMKEGLPHIETIGDNISDIVRDAIGEAFTISSIGNVIARSLDDKPEGRPSSGLLNDMIALCGVLTDTTERLKDYLQAIDDLKEETEDR